VRWALEFKQIQYKSTPINLLKGEHKEPLFLKKNPSGLVPALMVNGKSFTESLAIIEWLDEKFKGPKLLPSDSSDRAKVRELAYGVACAIQPIQNLKVMQYISQDPKQRISFAKHWIEEGFQALEEKLQTTAGSYSFGGEVTMADLCLVPQVYNALRFHVDMNTYPTIYRIHNNCLATKECNTSSPQNQPGAIP
jgi:maleylacetoacetate isomerase